MSRWKRFKGRLLGETISNVDQDEFGTTTIFVYTSKPLYKRLWHIIRPAFTSVRNFLKFVIGTIIVAIIGVTVGDYLDVFQLPFLNQEN